MSSSDPLAFLFGLERLGMKFGLGNMTRLCAELDHPERAFTSVLIAGTNGKGSVAAMTEAALRAAGHRTARYTSPHLVRLEERFVIDGAEVDAARLRDGAARVRDAAGRLVGRAALEEPPTFFECTTAIAFDLFREAHVDLAVLEVGLGGRLDATNVAAPIAAAITSIDLDHQAQLGDTVDAIAREKAGIITRPMPVVCGPLPPAADRVVERTCIERGARMVRAARAVEILAAAPGEPPVVDLRSGRRAIAGIRLALRGRHQIANAAVAVALLDELDALGWSVPDAAVRTGLSEVEWPGRLERFAYGGADVLVDAAHNPAGVRALADYLRETGWTGVTLVFGAMQDKDVSGMLAGIAPLCAAIVCTTPDTPRALPAAEVARLAAGLPGAPGRVDAIDPPPAALRHAAAAGGRVVVAGSIFLIGPLRDILR